MGPGKPNSKRPEGLTGPSLVADGVEAAMGGFGALAGVAAVFLGDEDMMAAVTAAPMPALTAAIIAVVVLDILAGGI